MLALWGLGLHRTLARAAARAARAPFRRRSGRHDAERELASAVHAWSGDGAVEEIAGPPTPSLAEVQLAEAQPSDVPQPESEPPETEEAKPVGPTPGNSAMILQMNSEILRREAERVKVELDQRLALNNAIMLRITQERDAFRRERDAEAARKKAAIEEQKAVGFEKTIELYESLSPKVAIEYLLDISDPNESARVLLKMETRKAKKIIEAAKQAEQKGRMKDILKRLREVAPGRSDELARQGG